MGLNFAESAIYTNCFAASSWYLCWMTYGLTSAPREQTSEAEKPGCDASSVLQDFIKTATFSGFQSIIYSGFNTAARILCSVQSDAKQSVSDFPCNSEGHSILHHVGAAILKHLMVMQQGPSWHFQAQGNQIQSEIPMNKDPSSLSAHTYQSPS